MSSGLIPWLFPPVFVTCSMDRVSFASGESMGMILPRYNAYVTCISAQSMPADFDWVESAGLF